MRLSPRLGFRLVLIAVAVVIILVRLIPRHTPHSAPRSTTRPAAHSSIPDLAQTSPLNQPGGGPVPPDAYPVYSALYQTPSQPAPDEPLAFAAESRTDIPQVGGSCLKPTTPDEHEMNDAFVAANQQSHVWEQKFTLPEPYAVLSPADTAQAQACLASHDSTSAGCVPYKQLRHVRFLGVPGFDRAHTHALVSVIKNCGGFCGSGGIFAVEKSGRSWKRSAPSSFTSDCSWTY